MGDSLSPTDMDGKTLKALRRRLGLSQSALAREVGVHPNTVARWEADDIHMRETTDRLIRRIATEKGVAK